MEATGLKNLDALEIGNEPDLYVGQGVRGMGYGERVYVEQWLEQVRDVLGNITGLERRSFQALTFSSGYNRGLWNESAAFRDGIDGNRNIKSVSFHHYQTRAVPTTRLAKDIMNHTAIVNGLSQFLPPITYLHTNNPSILFHLGEVGAALNSGPQDYALGGVFGDELWTVDYMLQAMTINVSRVHMQQGTGFSYSQWQPIPRLGTESYPPHVRAPYYGLVFIADFVGSSSSPLRVKELTLPSSANDEQFSAYAGYENGVLERVVLVNFAVWNSTQKGERPSQEVQLVVPQGVKSVRVERLTAPGADVYKGVAWNGTQWTFESDGVGVRVKNDSSVVSTVQGNVEVGVLASEALMIFMNR